MKAEFVTPKVDRDVTLTMKESEARDYVRVMGKISIADLSDHTGVCRDHCCTVEKVWSKLDDLLRDKQPK